MPGPVMSADDKLKKVISMHLLYIDFFSAPYHAHAEDFQKEMSGNEKFKELSDEFSKVLDRQAYTIYKSKLAQSQSTSKHISNQYETGKQVRIFTQQIMNGYRSSLTNELVRGKKINFSMLMSECPLLLDFFYQHVNELEKIAREWCENHSKPKNETYLKELLSKLPSYFEDFNRYPECFTDYLKTANKDVLTSVDELLRKIDLCQSAYSYNQTVNFVFENMKYRLLLKKEIEAIIYDGIKQFNIKFNTAEARDNFVSGLLQNTELMNNWYSAVNGFQAEFASDLYEKKVRDDLRARIRGHISTLPEVANAQSLGRSHHLLRSDRRSLSAEVEKKLLDYIMKVFEDENDKISVTKIIIDKLKNDILTASFLMKCIDWINKEKEDPDGCAAYEGALRNFVELILEDCYLSEDYMHRIPERYSMIWSDDQILEVGNIQSMCDQQINEIKKQLSMEGKSEKTEFRYPSRK